MSNFGAPKTSKAESIDKTPYTTYYPHKIAHTNRNWNQDYYQFVSIDPARKNYAIRIERRYHNGRFIALVFDKTSVEDNIQEDANIICNTYQMLTNFLDKYKSFYDDCHFIIIERQLPQNYKATRIAQHSISYFSFYLHNKPLLPSIVEVDPKLKGKMLCAPKNITNQQLKSWAIEKARELLTIRKDEFSLKVLDCFKKKQDDLCDTVCQLEALVMCWGFPITTIQPEITLIPNKALNSNIASLQLSKFTELAPNRQTGNIKLNIIENKTPSKHILTLNIKSNDIIPMTPITPNMVKNEDFFTIPTYPHLKRENS